MQDYKQSANSFIKSSFLALVMLIFLNGCDKSELDILKEENSQLAPTIQVLKEKNNELESNAKILNHEFQFLQKQSGKQKAELMSEYAIQFKDEITQSIRDEYRWSALKNASLILAFTSLPLLFFYYENIRKYKKLKKDSIDLVSQLSAHKDDLQKRYDEKVLEYKKTLDDYQQQVNEVLSKENQENRKTRSEKEEKIKLSGRIIEIQEVLNQSREKMLVNQ